MNERILVPIDDSEPARNALVEALEMFGEKEIVVLHVVELDQLSHDVGSVAAEELEETQESEAEELFEEAQATADEYGVTLQQLVGKGDAASAIVEAAETQDVDHVVMGSHGRSGLSRVVVGSVAEAVVREAPVSVTISRPETDTEE